MKFNILQISGSRQKVWIELVQEQTMTNQTLHSKKKGQTKNHLYNFDFDPFVTLLNITNNYSNNISMLLVTTN